MANTVRCGRAIAVHGGGPKRAEERPCWVGEIRKSGGGWNGFNQRTGGVNAATGCAVLTRHDTRNRADAPIITGMAREMLHEVLGG